MSEGETRKHIYLLTQRNTRRINQKTTKLVNHKGSGLIARNRKKVKGIQEEVLLL